MADCTICGQWAGLAATKHPECEKAVAEGRESPRVTEARNAAGAEVALGRKAVWNANAHATIAGVMIFFAAAFMGALWGHLASGDDEMPAFLIGALLGAALGLMHYYKARSRALDLERRHRVMDRS